MNGSSPVTGASGPEPPGLAPGSGAAPARGRPATASPCRRGRRRRTRRCRGPPILARAVTASAAVVASSAGRPVRRSISGCDGGGVAQQAEREGRGDPHGGVGIRQQRHQQRRGAEIADPPGAEGRRPGAPASPGPPGRGGTAPGRKSRASSAASTGASCSTTPAPGRRPVPAGASRRHSRHRAHSEPSGYGSLRILWSCSVVRPEPARVGHGMKHARAPRRGSRVSAIEVSSASRPPSRWPAGGRRPACSTA